MKKSIENWLLGIAVATFAIALFFTIRACGYDDKLKILAFAAGFIFFMYKLLTGWLFINLNIKIETERQSASPVEDHLVIKCILSKGSIDSLWLKDIEFRISYEMPEGNIQPLGTIKPQGMKKRMITRPADATKGDDYWNGNELEFYVLSPNEETSFSSYALVQADQIVLVEAVVIGTRPFYSIETKTKKRIQWRSSVIVLPVKKDKDIQA